MDIVNENDNIKITSFIIGIFIVLVFWFFYRPPSVIIETTDENDKK